jgi:hypothetical protein
MPAMNLESSALVTGLYQLTMLQAYFDETAIPLRGRPDDKN